MKPVFVYGRELMRGVFFFSNLAWRKSLSGALSVMLRESVFTEDISDSMVGRRVL